MVETITAESLRAYLSNLQEKDLLGEELVHELTQLTEEMDDFSNWLDASNYLRESNFKKMTGSGPMSKFLRTLAFLLEQIDDNAMSLKDRQTRVDRILIKNTTSGCSDYRGAITVLGTDEKGGTILLHEGRFVWDCAEHGMPQPEAARKLGYRCMVQFPALEMRWVPAD